PAGAVAGAAAATPLAAQVPVAAATAPAPALALVSLERLLPTLDPELGFVGLADLDTLASNQLTVRVKGAIGAPLLLRLNGQRVPESRVGRRVTASPIGLEAWEYVGLTLEPGVNRLELSTPRSAGRVAVRVVAPAEPASLWLAGPPSVPADGHGAAQLTLAVTDSAGIPVTTRMLVTLDASLGRIALDDLDPATPGVQVAMEGGRLRVPLL